MGCLDEDCSSVGCFDGGGKVSCLLDGEMVGS